MPNPPVIYIDIYQSRLRRVVRHPQTWRWRALNAGNRKKLAHSGEAYEHKTACKAAIHQLFASRSNVYLRERNQRNLLLRGAQ